MPTEPKPGSPEFFWLSPVQELQNILGVLDPKYDQVYNFLWQENITLKVVADFCVTEPGNPSDLTQTDCESGVHVDKYLQSARQAAFYRLCQDA